MCEDLISISDGIDHTDSIVNPMSMIKLCGLSVMLNLMCEDLVSISDAMIWFQSQMSFIFPIPLHH